MSEEEKFELDQLRQWKREAMIVLSQWDKVWEALGKPGTVGQDKSKSSLEAVKMLQQINKNLR